MTFDSIGDETDGKKRVFSKLKSHISLRSRIDRLGYKNSHRLATFLLTQFSSGKLYVSWSKNLLVESGVLDLYGDSKAFVNRLANNDFIRPRILEVNNFQFLCGGRLEPYVTKLLAEQKDVSLFTKQNIELQAEVREMKKQLKYVVMTIVRDTDPPVTEDKINRRLHDTKIESEELFND